MMSSDGAIFTRRALRLLDRLRQNEPTNAQWLAGVEEISLPTAHRVIRRLWEEYGTPIRWSPQEGSYQILDPTWRFAAADLVTRAEALALVYATGHSETVADPALRAALESLRRRIQETLRLDEGEIRRLRFACSSDRTDLAMLREEAVQLSLEAIARGHTLRFRYASPWREEIPREREVVPMHLRHSDGTPYLLAQSEGGNVVFNLAFAEAISIGSPAPEILDLDAISQWAASYGVWMGERVIEIAVWISPSAARYYARQQWHASQIDRLLPDGRLLRTLPGHDAPEIRRRLLSLGDHLSWVEPSALRNHIRRCAGRIAQNLDRDESP